MQPLSWIEYIYFPQLQQKSIEIKPNGWYTQNNEKLKKKKKKTHCRELTTTRASKMISYDWYNCVRVLFYTVFRRLFGWFSFGYIHVFWWQWFFFVWNIHVDCEARFGKMIELNAWKYIHFVIAVVGILFSIDFLLKSKLTESRKPSAFNLISFISVVHWYTFIISNVIMKWNKWSSKFTNDKDSEGICIIFLYKYAIRYILWDLQNGENAKQSQR